MTAVRIVAVMSTDAVRDVRVQVRCQMTATRLAACVLSLVPLGVAQVRHLSTDQIGSVWYFASGHDDGPSGCGYAADFSLAAWPGDRSVRARCRFVRGAQSADRFEGRLAESRDFGSFPPMTEIAGAAPVTNASGSVVVYETLAADGKNRLLLGLDRATGRQWFLWADPGIESSGVVPRDPLVSAFFTYPYPEFPGSMFDAAIDHDGRLVAIKAREQARQRRRWLVIVPVDGSTPRWLFDAGEEILELTISGNGRFVFLATASGKLMRVEVESGDVLELFRQTPWIKEVIGAAALGARNRIVGGGFSPVPLRAETSDGAAELAGFRVEYNRQPMPLFEVTPREIVFRIPMDFDTRDHGYALRVTGPSESGFLPVPLSRSNEGAFSVMNSVAIEPPGAIGDDGQPINLSRPIRPAEVISIFSTGWRTVAPNMDCVMTVAFGSDRSEHVGFPVLSHAPVLEKPGLFELRLAVPENIDQALDRSRGLQCFGGDPLGGFVLWLPLRK